jgi:hypothetical protein
MLMKNKHKQNKKTKTNKDKHFSFMFVCFFHLCLLVFFIHACVIMFVCFLHSVLFVFSFIFTYFLFSSFIYVCFSFIFLFISTKTKQTERELRIFQALCYSVQFESKNSKQLVFENLHKQILPPVLTFLTRLLPEMTNFERQQTNSSILQYILEYVLAVFDSFKTLGNFLFYFYFIYFIYFVQLEMILQTYCYKIFSLFLGGQIISLLFRI